jgi:hypothetical protein
MNIRCFFNFHKWAYGPNQTPYSGKRKCILCKRKEYVDSFSDDNYYWFKDDL